MLVCVCCLAATANKLFEDVCNKVSASSSVNELRLPFVFAAAKVFADRKLGFATERGVRAFE
jgi:hypothetical protein